MRNEVAYQAYMGFLLKSLFWMSSVTLLIVFFLLLIDTFFLLFAPRQKAKIIRADIASIGKKTRFVDAHGIFISYTFQYKNQTYHCQNLNAYGRVTVNGYYKALSIIHDNIIDNQITVYVCPFNPNFSIVLPFKGITSLKKELLIIFLAWIVPAITLGYI